MENKKEQVVAEWKAVNEPRLKEIKSANPELYSAINLALNYLNKKLTGEELPVEVEEEVVVETQPDSTKQWKLSDFYNTKIELDTPLKSRRFQELIFELGGAWSSNRKTSIDSKKYIFIDENGKLESTATKIYFDKTPIKEIFYDDIFPKESETDDKSWRFKTMQELKETQVYKDYGTLGTDSNDFNSFIGKPLVEIYSTIYYNSLSEAVEALKKNELRLGERNWSIAKEYLTQEPLPTTEQISTSEEGYSLPIETYPSKLKTPISGFSRNTGDRKAPTQSAGELKRKAQVDGNVNEILGTKFKGNDGEWYAINVGRGSVWTWKKTTPPPVQSQTNSTTKQATSSKQPDDYDFLIGKKVEVGDAIWTIKIIRETNISNLYQVKFETSIGKPHYVDFNENELKLLSQGRNVNNYKLVSESDSNKQEEAKKEWVPEDLVGKTLYFLNSGSNYKVLKFTRNNPKNKEYLLQKVGGADTIKYRISFSLVKKWLDGMRASGVEIVKN